MTDSTSEATQLEPTDDQRRRAREVMSRLTDMQRRAVVAVVSHEAALEFAAARKVDARAPDLPAPGKWPCQTEAPGGDVLDRALPPRLTPFLYRLLRDGAPAPGDLEQIAIDIADHDGPVNYTNPHLEGYARALAVFLMYRPRGEGDDGGHS